MTEKGRIARMQLGLKEKKEMSDPIWDEQSFEKQTRDSILTSRWFTISLAVLAGIIGLVILYYLFYPSSQSNGNQYVIEPGMKPMKEKPENPGGMRFPHQDKMVYENLLGNKNKVQEEQEVVLSSDFEAPLEIIEKQPMPEMQKKGNNAPLTVEEITPVIERVVVEEPLVIREKVERSVADIKKSVKKKIAKAHKTGASYKVQLAALPNKNRVEHAWRKIRRAHKNLLAGQKMAIEEVTLPKKGTVYRLQVGAFKSRSQALALCKKLKAENGSCFVPK